MEQAVQRLGYVVLGVPDLAESVDFYASVGHLTVHDASSRSAYLGGGYDHHWLAIEESSTHRGLRRVGFELSSAQALDEVADRLAERRIPHEEIGDLDGDGIDRGLRFTDPDGVQVDVYTDMLSRAVKPTQDVVRMTEMLHAVWFSADPVAAHAFYAEVLGFRASDWIKRNAVFLRARNNYHHSLGIFRSSPARSGQLDHFCILVESIDDVMRGRNIALRRGASLQKDVLRHAASGSISVYIADPATGISFEFCAEHDIVAPDHRPRLLEASPITRDVWQAGSPGLAKVAPLGATAEAPLAAAAGVSSAGAPAGAGSEEARVADLANSLA
ncbi:VOC family protein [Frankia sp. AgB1.9]|uniref:VOC family protein n=1 Tax=unclassified Frankia TaxID=2632575 RepID=UPI001933DA37|nr:MULTISPECIES: VOC family protein [unclassified Frankia]MBL7493517.1 VOC family protein [Frankia sp. AgW1.1]MBL7552742.1 VOC family protein [Frankia sp. AgB1.9]MBL7624649.1 VOC family protein [Frankia sp. AgB1.8]